MGLFSLVKKKNKFWEKYNENIIAFIRVSYLCGLFDGFNHFKKKGQLKEEDLTALLSLYEKFYNKTAKEFINEMNKLT